MKVICYTEKNVDIKQMCSISYVYHINGEGNMRLLFEIDKKDYNIYANRFVRPSVRSTIIKENKIAMVYSQKYHYYKFPGGGIEQKETQIDALVRETREEVGLDIIKDSIEAYGKVHRIQKNFYSRDIFIQDNYYYLCKVNENLLDQQLDEYELKEGFVLEYVDPWVAIRTNKDENHGPKDLTMINREVRVLELLLEEGFLDK